MAKLAIYLLAAFLLASYASATATNLEEICKSTVDPQYCQELLHYTVSADNSFNSATWRKLVIDRAAVVSMNASSAIAKLPKVSESNKNSLSACSDKLEQSIKLLREAAAQYGGKVDVSGKVDHAASNNKACYDSLDSASKEITTVRDAANKAYNACRIVKDIISKK